MNELEKRKKLKFKNKSFLLGELSNALLSLNKATRTMIQKIEKGVEYTEFIELHHKTSWSCTRGCKVLISFNSILKRNNFTKIYTYQ